MSRVRMIALAFLVIVFTGCGRTDKEATEHQPPVQQQPVVQPAPPPPAAPESAPPAVAPEPPKKVAHKAPAPKPKPERKIQPVKTAAPVETATQRQEPIVTPSAISVATAPRETEAPPPPKPPEPKIFTIPNGTVINVRLQDPLDSGVNKSGDSFSAILDQDVTVDGTIVAARGSLLKGKLSHVAQSGRIEGRASMSLQLVTMVIANQTYPILTEILSFEAESTKKRDAAKVGVGAGLGAVIGAIAGGGKGAAIGAAVGAGAGGATVAVTRGKEIQLEREHKLSFALSRDITVKLQ